jgi:hypothetical protein
MSFQSVSGKEGGEAPSSPAAAGSKRRDRSRSESVPAMSVWPLVPHSVESIPPGGGNGTAAMGSAATGSGSEGVAAALAVTSATGMATSPHSSQPNLAFTPLPPMISPASVPHGTMSFPSSKMTSSAGDLAASPYGAGPALYVPAAPPSQSGSRRSGSMGVSPSAGRSSSTGAHWGSGGYPHHQFQPPQPYPDHRSSSAALPLRPRLSDISESEDDTGDDDSPRTVTPPRSRQRNKRASTARYEDALVAFLGLISCVLLLFRSGSADNHSASGSQSERSGQPQYFSRWKLNKSVIPPEIQAYTDQVRRQHLIIDDSRDGTGSASSSGQSPRHTSSSKHHPTIKNEPSQHIPPLAGMPQMAYPAAYGGMPYGAPPHPQGGRTSSLPAQVYLQYAGYAPMQSMNTNQSALSSTPSSPRASSAVVAPSWGMAPNPFFPNQASQMTVPGVPMGSEMFYASAQFRGHPFPPPQFLPSAVPVGYPGTNIPYGAPMFQGGGTVPPLNGSGSRSADSLPSSQPMSPRTNSSFPSPYGSSSAVPSSSLEELMKEKLFALADVAAVAAHKSGAKFPLSEQMDVSSDEEDMSEASDDRSGGTRMQL